MHFRDWRWSVARDETTPLPHDIHWQRYKLLSVNPIARPQVSSGAKRVTPTERKGFIPRLPFLAKGQGDFCEASAKTPLIRVDPSLPVGQGEFKR